MARRYNEIKGRNIGISLLDCQHLECILKFSFFSVSLFHIPSEKTEHALCLFYSLRTILSIK